MTPTTTFPTDFALAIEGAVIEEEFVARFAALLVAAPAPAPAERALDAVVRKYRCPDCGYRHEDGVEVTLDEPVLKPARIVGYWCCDECGADFFENVRVVAKDFP